MKTGVEEINPQRLFFGKREHFRCTESQSVPNPNRNPAERIRFGSEEIPCPAKKPRRKAGIRAKQGISELVRAAGLEPAHH